MWRSVLLTLGLLSAAPVLAQDGARATLGGDVYSAGRSVEVEGAAGDLFAAGGRVTLDGDIGGSAHLAGRVIDVDAPVGVNLYAAGMNVDVAAPVSGNVSALGNSVTVSAPVSGNLRAMGGDVTLIAPVAGSAALGGETIVIDGEIAGDLAISGQDIDWGEGASVSGTIFFYTDEPDEVSIPASVAPAERIDVRNTEEWDDEVPGETPDDTGGGFWAGLGALFGSVLVTGLVAFVIAALAPRFTMSLRERALDAPLRTLWFGALGLATAIGATFVVAMTGIGIFIAPLTLMGAALVGFLGYVMGAYLLGVWALGAVGQGTPDSTGDRAAAAFVGAALLTLVMLIPFVGWLAGVAVLLIGVGGWVIRLFEPSFRGAGA